MLYSEDVDVKGHCSHLCNAVVNSKAWEKLGLSGIPHHGLYDTGSVPCWKHEKKDQRTYVWKEWHVPIKEAQAIIEFVLTEQYAT